MNNDEIYDELKAQHEALENYKELEKYKIMLKFLAEAF